MVSFNIRRARSIWFILGGRIELLNDQGTATGQAVDDAAGSIEGTPAPCIACARSVERWQPKRQ